MNDNSSKYLHGYRDENCHEKCQESRFDPLPLFWMYGIVLDENTSLDAAQFAQKLREKVMETRPFFLGMHEQPVFHDMGLFQDEKYPVAERIARQGLYLPSGLTLTEPQVDQVAEAVRAVFA